MTKAVSTIRLPSWIFHEVKPLPLVAVLTLCAWTTLVNLMIWCLS
jgi:hypothetical protein